METAERKAELIKMESSEVLEAALDRLQPSQLAETPAAQAAAHKLHCYHTLRILLRQQVPLALDRFGISLMDPTLDGFVGDLASRVHTNWDAAWKGVQKAFHAHEKKENKRENPNFDPLDGGPHGLAGPGAA